MAGTNPSFALTRKLVMERGWRQTQVGEMKRSDEDNKEEGNEKHRLYQCPCWKEVRNHILEQSGKWEQRANTSRKIGSDRGITLHPLSKGRWKKSQHAS